MLLYVLYFFSSDVPSSPHGVKIVDISQTFAKVSFNKPDSHGGVPIHHYQVDVKEVTSETWKVVLSHAVQSKSAIRKKRMNFKIICQFSYIYIFIL